MIEIYTDGSCIKNPNGPGGYGVIMIDNEKREWHLSDYDGCTTNNRMELKAVIEGIKLLEKGDKICKVYSDSKLTINCCSGIWKRKANLDLWKEYDDVSKGKSIDFVWIKAHNGNYYNELVDKMAYNEAKRINKK